MPSRALGGSLPIFLEHEGLCACVPVYYISKLRNNTPIPPRIQTSCRSLQARHCRKPLL